MNDVFIFIAILLLALITIIILWLDSRKTRKKIEFLEEILAGFVMKDIEKKINKFLYEGEKKDEKK